MVDFFSKTRLSLPSRLYVPFVGNFQGFRDLSSFGWTIGRVIGQTITPILSWTSQEHEESGPFYKLGDEVDEVEGFVLIIKIDELEHRQLEAAAQTARTASLSDKILSDKILSHEPCESTESDVEDELKQLMTDQIQSIQANIQKIGRLLLLATHKITALQMELRAPRSDDEKITSANEQIQKLQAVQIRLRNRLSALTEELKTLCT